MEGAEMSSGKSCPTVHDAMSDDELRRLESIVPRGDNQHFIPKFPLSILQAVVDADAALALPLILAIHRQLMMTKRDETPLNDAIWRSAGSPSHKRRAAILRKLKPLSGIIRITSARAVGYHYRVSRGDLWQTS
jgi:hypothetical protein